MSAEKTNPPSDDDREKQDWGKQSQSNKPWKQNAQNTTDPSPPDTPKPDLEKWKETKTH
ncbi:hypothetical protein [Tardiphaga sp. 619_E2_N8_5]|uniref:hypothetical protein n=1 Tax=unclassified Tardiphaga TaxID=2631404 RepID=UPI003F23BA42